MKTKVEKLEKNKAKVTVTFTAEEFDKVYEEKLEEVVKKHEEKGFRKGAYPKQRYLAKYGDYSVLEKSLDSLVDKTYYEIITSKKVNAVSQPEFEIGKMEKGKPFSYTMVVDVYPEVVLGQYLGLEVEKETVTVTEEEIEAEVNRNLKMHSDLEISEGGALEEGDTAVFDFTGYNDGVPFPGGKAENYELEIGSHSFIPGFEEQMVGMKANEEKTITVHFPADYQEESLKDKDAQFELKLHEIKKRVLPQLDDEFVASLEIENVSNVASWKEHLAATIKQEKEEAANNKYDSDIIEKVYANCELDIPEAMIEREVNYYVKSLEEQAKKYGLNADMLLAYQGTNLEQYKELSRPRAIDAIKYELIMTKIAEVEKLKITNSEYENYYDNIAKRTNKDKEEIKKQISKDQIKNYLLVDKAYQLVKNSVK